MNHQYLAEPDRSLAHAMNNTPTNVNVDSRPTELLILAGGLGTRLRKAVSDVPKPMAPVNGVPFLDHLMAYWRSQEVKRFVLSVGYMAESIQAHFGDRYLDCSIDYLPESSPLGTGGAIRNAIINGRWSGRRLLVINGDTWFPIKLEKLVADADAMATPVTIAVKRVANNDRYGGVLVNENGKVDKFISDGVGLGNPLINGGIYLADIATLAHHLRLRLGVFSFERDVLQELATSGLLGASLQNVEFLDIGVPEDYLRAGDIVFAGSNDRPNPY